LGGKMIISNIITTFIQVIFRPQIILPILAFLIAGEALLTVTGVMIDKTVMDFYLYEGTLPSENLVGYFLFTYPLEFISMIVLATIMMIISTMAMICVTKMAKGESLIDSINESVLEVKKSTGIAVLFWSGLVIAAFAWSLISSVASLNSALGTFLGLIFLLLLGFILIKLVFVFPALAENDLKKAFKKSWEFTENKFWKALLFIIIALFISASIANLLAYAGFLMGELPEMVFTIIAQAFNVCFFTAAITNYFYSKK